jgi:hypothetical protein
MKGSPYLLRVAPLRYRPGTPMHYVCTSTARQRCCMDHSQTDKAPPSAAVEMITIPENPLGILRHPKRGIGKEGWGRGLGLQIYPKPRCQVRPGPQTSMISFGAYRSTSPIEHGPRLCVSFRFLAIICIICIICPDSIFPVYVQILLWGLPSVARCSWKSLLLLTVKALNLQSETTESRLLVASSSQLPHGLAHPRSASSTESPVAKRPRTQTHY